MSFHPHSLHCSNFISEVDAHLPPSDSLAARRLTPCCARCYYCRGWMATGKIGGSSLRVAGTARDPTRSPHSHGSSCPYYLSGITSGHAGLGCPFNGSTKIDPPCFVTSLLACSSSTTSELCAAGLQAEAAELPQLAAEQEVRSEVIDSG